MAKPLKFHQTLNQAPRSAKHGQHRRASPTTHGYSVIGTDHGAGGSDQSGAITVAWNTGTITIDDTAFDRAFFADPKPRAIPHAGIRTGELIGYRLWWLIQGQLCSLAHRRLWAPNETIYGDTNKVVQRDWMFTQVVWGGTYAFADKDDLIPEIAEHHENTEKLARLRANGVIWFASPWHPYDETQTLVEGTIKMWGDVIEHETGYRAEFAKLNSIDEIYGPGDIEALRHRYFSLTSTIRTEP